MKPTEPDLWGIHAGKTGDADTRFLKKHCVALPLKRVCVPEGDRGVEE